jgi:hypothetical protein
MTFSDGCPCGRSQHLTFAESRDKFLVDRKTFDKLLFLVGWCANELIKARHRDCDNFFTALDISRSTDSPETSDNLEIRKACLLLNYYHDIIPEALDELQRRSDETKKILDSWEIVRDSFCGRYGND